MEKGATDEVPPVVGPALDLPRPRHSMAARLVASVRVTRAGLGAAASGLVAVSQGAEQGLAADRASLGTTSWVATGHAVLDASSGVAGAVSQESSAGMAAAAAQMSEAAAGQASQVTDGDNDQSDLLGGLNSSQNLEATNKKRNRDDCTPEASRSQSLEISSKTKGKHSKSKSGPSKRSRSGSNQPGARARYKA